MKTDIFYQGKLNSKRIKAIQKVSEECKINSGTVGFVFGEGVKFAASQFPVPQRQIDPIYFAHWIMDNLYVRYWGNDEPNNKKWYKQGTLPSRKYYSDNELLSLYTASLFEEWKAEKGFVKQKNGWLFTDEFNNKTFFEGESLRAEYEKQFTANDSTQWIDVNERLPDNETLVWVFISENRKQSQAYFSGRYFNGCDYPLSVTHWKILPEPPIK